MELFPEGLSQKEFTVLSKCTKEVADHSIDSLLSQAKDHLQKAYLAYKENIFVNYRLAEAIFYRFNTIIKEWESIPQHARPWCRGMMKYFILSSDLESDFTSPIGFDDDVEIMNACLRLAGREDLCLNPEDFDDV